MIIFLWDNIFQVSDDRLQIPIHLEKQLQYSKTRYIFFLSFTLSWSGRG